MGITLKRFGLGLFWAVATVMFGAAVGSVLLLILELISGYSSEFGAPLGVLKAFVQASLAVRALVFAGLDFRMLYGIARTIAWICAAIVVAASAFRPGPDDELLWRLVAYVAYTLPWAKFAWSVRLLRHEI
jgi:hypothetical protein